MSEVPTDHRCVKFTDCFGNIYNAAVIWYFDPGSIFCYSILNPPHGKLTLLISTKREGFIIP
jgi:hypothetical protein